MTNILMSRSEALVSDFAKKDIEKILSKEMKVCVIGLSFFGELDEETYFKIYDEESEYQQKIYNNFNEYGITDVKWVYYYKQSLAEMTQIINEADVLYFPGGAPDLMFERIKEKEILEPLRNHKGIVIGSSAGAMIQLKLFHISPDNEYFKFSLHEGLGYIDNFFIEVHYRRRRKQKSSLVKMRRRYKLDTYTIPDDGLVIVKDGKIKTLGTALHYSNKLGKIKY